MLVHTDGHTVLVVEHIPGHVVSDKRYPEQPLDPTTLDAVLGTVTAFAQWSPPKGVLAPVFDYRARIERYHHAGFPDADDRYALHTALEKVSASPQPSHGDPLPANLLLTESGGCALLDLEYTGLFLPGFHLAMLHTLLAETPGPRTPSRLWWVSPGSRCRS